MPKRKPVPGRLTSHQKRLAMLKEAGDIWALHLQGMSPRLIARELGLVLVPGTLDWTVKKAGELIESVGKIQKDNEDLRNLEAERLDELQSANWRVATGSLVDALVGQLNTEGLSEEAITFLADRLGPALADQHRAATVVLGVMAQRAKLLGLNKQQEVNVNNTVVMPVIQFSIPTTTSELDLAAQGVTIDIEPVEIR